MWKDVASSIRQALFVGQKLEQHSLEIKELQNDVETIDLEIQKLAQANRDIHTRLDHERELAAREKEMAARDQALLIARLELYLERAKHGTTGPLALSEPESER